MANEPISSLPVAIALDGSEYTDLVQGGTTKRAQVSLINSVNPANIPIGGLTGQGLVKQSNANYDTAWKTVSGFGTVQEIDTGTGLTGGPITLTGTVSLAAIASHTLLANVTGGSAAPTPNTPSSVLDIIGATQGDILYRSASGWAALPPGTNGQILTTGGAAANPAWSAVGSGTVQSVGLSLPGIFTVSGSPVTTAGTLTGTLNTQNANLVWAGPGTGAAAAPTFRALVGADLPNPSASTLGGIRSTVGASHQWISSISTAGIPALTQPAFTDISGVATGAQLPNPSPTTLGGIQSFAPQASKWINTISTSGVPSATQPGFGDLTGSATLAQLPAIGNNTIVSNISGGSATPLANSLTSLIDTIGATQGDILYRNASTWTVLAPGTSGQVLSSGGAVANPSWTTVSGTGTVTSVATNNGLTGGPITSSGTIGLAAIATGNLLAYTGAGSGVPVATAPTAILDVIGSTEGDILYRGASSWSALAPGTNGQFLQTPGGGSTPSWGSAVIPSGSPTNGQIAQWTSSTVVQGANPAAIGSSWVLLSKQTASTSSALNFSNLITGFTRYIIVVDALTPATDDVYCVLQVGTGATPTYQATNYLWCARFQGSAGGADTGSSLDGNVTTSMPVSRPSIGSGIDNGGTLAGGFQSTIYLTASSAPNINYHSTWIRSDGTAASQSGGGQWSNAATAITSVRLQMSSGNITSGTASLYGIRDS